MNRHVKLAKYIQGDETKDRFVEKMIYYILCIVEQVLRTISVFIAFAVLARS